MRTGSPGFNGRRLIEAREVNGITAKALATLIGVAPSSVSQYENGKQTPSSDVLELLASKLGLPERFFFAPDRPQRSGTTFFRSLVSASKASRQVAWWRLGWVADLTIHLEQYLTLPIPNIYDPGFGVDPSEIKAADIERAAAGLRSYWGLKSGAISDVVLLAEYHGVVVSRQHLFEEREDALSEPLIDSHRDYVLLNADKECAVRSRFDLAHELGHMVLHRHVPEELKQAHHRLIEKQANLFAGAFLLPEETFLADFTIPSLEVFEYLKPKWKVAIGAMIMRARALRVLDEADSTRLFKKYRYRGWHKREPLDDKLEAERPRLLRRSIDALFNSGIQSRADLRMSVPIPQRSIEDSASLPRGYLSDEAAVVNILQIKPKRTGERAHATPATVHPIRPGLDR